MTRKACAKGRWSGPVLPCRPGTQGRGHKPPDPAKGRNRLSAQHLQRSQAWRHADLSSGGPVSGWWPPERSGRCFQPPSMRSWSRQPQGTYPAPGETRSTSSRAETHGPGPGSQSSAHPPEPCTFLFSPKRWLQTVVLAVAMSPLPSGSSEHRCSHCYPGNCTHSSSHASIHSCLRKRLPSTHSAPGTAVALETQLWWSHRVAALHDGQRPPEAPGSLRG